MNEQAKTLLLESGLISDAQKELVKAHGTPDEFAKAVFDAVPGFISMDEALDAIEKYRDDFRKAGQ